MMLSAFLTNPILFRPGFAMIRTIANSKLSILNPDRNILLRTVLKPVLYNHFCAGTNAAEIRETIDGVKKLGFSGVALIYNKEIQIASNHEFLGAQQVRVSEIDEWRRDTLEALKMIPDGNWLGMKLTGAGQRVTEALLSGSDPPADFVAAMEEICTKTAEKHCTLWIDAEQQAVQPTIDRWSIDLMRRHNRGKNAVVYSTIQAYLKESRQKLIRQLQLSENEGWTLGVKLVRGAYMSVDDRQKIHDSKAETDACYDGLVYDLLSGSLDSFSKKSFPSVQLVLAGHNSETVRKALLLAQDLAARGQLKVSPAFAQLQGMADDVGGEIIHFGDAELAKARSATEGGPQIFVPKVYKALHWGTIQESMQYLVRRAVENSAAVGRMRESALASRKELVDRVKHRLWKN